MHQLLCTSCSLMNKNDRVSNTCYCHLVYLWFSWKKPLAMHSKKTEVFITAVDKCYSQFSLQTFSVFIVTSKHLLYYGRRNSVEMPGVNRTCLLLFLSTQAHSMLSIWGYSTRTKCVCFGVSGSFFKKVVFIQNCFFFFMEKLSMYRGTLR